LGSERAHGGGDCSSGPCQVTIDFCQPTDVQAEQQALMLGEVIVQRQSGLIVHASERLLPRGLCAGFITEVYLRGPLDEQVMYHARQKSIPTTQAYRRRAKITQDSPARLLDL
jgi:hypothetical protein